MVMADILYCIVQQKLRVMADHRKFVLCDRAHAVVSVTQQTTPAVGPVVQQILSLVWYIRHCLLGVMAYTV